jgi:asparagine synthase (glutamine-hydrolysing)
MCGITGHWELQADASAEVLGTTARAMVDTITHRGPDDSGVWVDAATGIALGHRRLSIIDLSADGAQPMVSASGRYTIVYNGEIYNYQVLRDELESAGCKFRGRSDTEVALEAMEFWGIEEALGKFNGMFAFALWDARERRLILARDRAGKKPLYYSWTGGSGARGAFVFGSELKTLKAHPGFEAGIDRDALSALIRYAWIPGPSTIYRNVYKLEPGSIMIVSATGDAAQRTYWSPREVAERCASNPFEGDLTEATAELDRLLRGSVRDRMISDVPLGALLSGGIDSSVVVALMQEMSSQPIRTFAIGFREPKYNEAHYAEAVARHLGTPYRGLFPSPPLFDRMPTYRTQGKRSLNFLSAGGWCFCLPRCSTCALRETPAHERELMAQSPDVGWFVTWSDSNSCTAFP